MLDDWYGVSSTAAGRQADERARRRGSEAVRASASVRARAAQEDAGPGDADGGLVVQALGAVRRLAVGRRRVRTSA